MNLAIKNLEKVIQENNLSEKIEIDKNKKLVLVSYKNGIEAIPFCNIAGSSVFIKKDIIKIYLTTSPHSIKIPAKYKFLRYAV